MPLAGEIIVAGQIPGERIETTIRVIDSANVTTEAVIDTVIAPVVAGRTYKITWDGRVNTTVAGDDFLASVREDSLTGNILQQVAEDIAIVGRQGRTQLEAEYTADVTEDKTFVATLSRLSGAGGVHGDAAAASPTYLYVDYIRD